MKAAAFLRTVCSILKHFLIKNLIMYLSLESLNNCVTTLPFCGAGIFNVQLNFRFPGFI
jgi:hypothetical protein